MKPCSVAAVCARWIVLSSAIGLGCGSVGTEAARVEAGLVGLKARTLRQCLGDAAYLELREDGSELWGYAFAAPAGRGGDIEISRAVGRGTAFQRPRVESGEPIERDPGDESTLLEDRNASLGQCLHVFRIVDGVVASYTGRGKTYSGLNANAVCTVALDRCVPPEPTTPSSD